MYIVVSLTIIIMCTIIVVGFLLCFLAYWEHVALPACFSILHYAPSVQLYAYIVIVRPVYICQVLFLAHIYTSLTSYYSACLVCVLSWPWQYRHSASHLKLQKF